MRPWRTRLLDGCSGGAGLCCYAYACLPCFAGDVAALAARGAGGDASSAYARDCTAAICGASVCAWASTRGQVRERFGIDEGGAGCDLLAVVCCPQLALIQEHNELVAASAKGGASFASNPSVGAQPQPYISSTPHDFYVAPPPAPAAMPQFAQPPQDYYADGAIGAWRPSAPSQAYYASSTAGDAPQQYYNGGAAAASAMTPQGYAKY